MTFSQRTQAFALTVALGACSSLAHTTRTRTATWALLALVMALSGCVKTIPEVIYLSVYHTTVDGYYATCEGGLMGRFTVGSLELQSPKVAPLAQFQVSQLKPEDAPIGTEATVEATCYGAQGTEIGYSRVVSNWHGADDHNVFILGPLTNPSRTSSGCLPAEEARGDPPCISSSLLD